MAMGNNEGMIEEVFRAYMENVDSFEPPDLSELAELFGIEAKIVKAAAKKQKWEVKRARARRRREVLVQQTEEAALANQVLDLVSEQNKMIRANLRIINQDIPKFHNELLARMEDMDDKNFIAAYKLLREIQTETEALFVRVGKELQAKDADEGNRTDGFDLGLGAKIANIIQRAKDINADELTEDDIFNMEAEQDDLFNELDAR